MKKKRGRKKIIKKKIKEKTGADLLFLLSLTLFLIFLVFCSYIVFFDSEQPSHQKKLSSMTSYGAIGTGQIYFSILGVCSIDLGQGWNLISLGANLSNTSIKKVLSPIEGDYKFILKWNNSAQEFLIYSPRSSDNPFTHFDQNESYFIYFTQPHHSLQLQGNAFGDRNLSSYFGWDTPAYPYEFKTNISQYLNTINNQYKFAMKWNNSAQEFLIYSPRAAQPEFNTILPGEGQFLYVTNPSGVIIKYNRSKLIN